MMQNLWSRPIADDQPALQRPTLQCLTPIVVILPIHNAQATLPSTLRKVQQYLYRHPHVSCLFINDGSTDRSDDILSQGIRQAKTPQLQMLRYQTRAGKGYAVRLGMQAAIGQCEYLCLMDGDRADSLDHLDDLMMALQRSDIVIGNRQTAIPTRKSFWIRRLVYGMTLQLAQHWLGIAYTDPQAGLKGFRRAAAQTLFQRQTIDGWGFDLELLYIAKKHHLTIAEIPAQPRESQQRQTTPIRLWRDYFCLLSDALSIRRNDLFRRYR